MLTEKMRNYVIDKVTGDKAIRIGLKKALLKDLDFKQEEVLESRLYVKDDLIWLKVRFMDDDNEYQKSKFSYAPDTLYYTIQPLLANVDKGLVHEELCDAYDGLREAIDDYRKLHPDICDPIRDKLEGVNNAICRIGEYLHLRPWQRPNR